MQLVDLRAAKEQGLKALFRGYGRGATKGAISKILITRKEPFRSKLIGIVILKVFAIIAPIVE